MKKFLTLISIVLFISLLPQVAIAQVIEKPVGCFAGTNGLHPDVLVHPEARGVLLLARWQDVEPSPGVFDFSSLDADIATVTNAGLKYSLMVAGGAFGSPDWLVDSLNADVFTFTYQGQSQMLPLWWDTTIKQRLDTLITKLGDQYSSDPMLSHVYVTQMTTNGAEGHLNGVNMTSFANAGYNDQDWIDCAKSTTYKFASAFPDKPIVFEIHEIDQDTIVPATIIDDLYGDPNLCERVGLAMWWISGKTTYQSDLLTYISNFQGDKYAQVIGRSDQTHRFQDSLYSTVFVQAKDLDIRYIEPWPYEFQHSTHDSLLQDFNMWADNNFSTTSSCSPLSVDLINFTGYPQGDKVLLEWQTASEINNEKFEIEISSTGIDFQTIGEVAGNGTTAQVNNYVFTVDDPFAGANYFRLKQIDFDGQFEYSEVVTVNFNISGLFFNNNKERIGGIYPNPSKPGFVYLDFHGLKTKTVYYSVFDLRGKLIAAGAPLGTSSEHTLQFDFKFLEKGVYIVKIEAEGDLIARKLIVE